MGEARKMAMNKGIVNELFTIRKLSLTGFVVDVYPFERWFDPEKLQEIEFKNDCIDAGFSLTSPMLERVNIKLPPKKNAQPTTATVISAGTAKVVKTAYRSTQFSELKEALESMRSELDHDDFEML